MYYICDRMLRLVSIILFWGVIAQTFSGQVYLAGFLLNRHYISSELCEKRNEPLNNCHGKCHLKKEISRDQDQQENKNNTLKKGVEIFYSEYPNQPDFIYDPAKTPGNFTFLRLPLCTGYLKSVFHPPGYPLFS